MKRRWIGWAITTLLILLVVVGSFFAVRALTGGGSETTVEQAPTAKPTRGPGWWEPYLEEDSKKPRLTTQKINSILVGPSDLYANPDICADAKPENVPFEEAVGSQADFNPSYLPEGVELVPELVSAWACGDTIVLVQKSYNVPTVRNPEDPYTLVWAGGTIVIFRRMNGPDSFPLYGAAERIGPATIAGMPAVLERPVIPDGVDNGISQATLVIKDSFGLTVVQGGGLPLVEFTKIAESLYLDSEGPPATEMPAAATLTGLPELGRPTPTAPAGAASLCLPLRDGAKRRIEGDVDSGSLVLTLALVEDPVYKPAPEAWHPYAVTDIPGLGWRFEWLPRESLDGPLRERWSIWVDGEAVHEADGPEWDSVAAGVGDNRESGVYVGGGDARAGQRIDFVVEVLTPDRVYGAKMSIQVRDAGGYLQACDPSFGEWIGE